MRHKILIVSAVALFTLSSCGEDFFYIKLLKAVLTKKH